ncbi:hypothetical protein CCHL11_06160 [Colletotrichum chlorophyti]|uniref:Uncharacterized protein n=1 Tax=Colletotrichum chlorophyti TaxID=708187 RepID=A0A1Q8RTB9_9PEZI|nr:hypothetical protein CCHL11_06160 [Colletotrichum chlorophyti]
MLRAFTQLPAGRFIPRPSRATVAATGPSITVATSAQLSTTSPPSKTESKTATTSNQAKNAPDENSGVSAPTQKKKTVAELDEDLRLKLEAMSGEGGAAGVEYENGTAEGLKRGVKSNMFRVI